jgi:hypothetical protein
MIADLFSLNDDGSEQMLTPFPIQQRMRRTTDLVSEDLSGGP